TIGAGCANTCSLGFGGERGIRTPEAVFSRLHTFQACSFNHSDTSPLGGQFYLLMPQWAMSYLVLARKWRPRRFSELVGQEHVVRALTNALETGRVHHAF